MFRLEDDPAMAIVKLERTAEGIYLKVNNWIVAELRDDGILSIIGGMGSLDGEPRVLAGMQIERDGAIKCVRVV